MADLLPFAQRIAHVAAVAGGKAMSRTKLIAAVHAAAKRKGMDEDMRRDAIERATGKRSLGDCDAAEIGRVLDQLNTDRPAASGRRAHAAKALALWWNLYWLGEVDCAPGQVEAALDAFVQRQTGIARLAFLDPRSAPAVIEALKDWCARTGVVWDAGIDPRQAVALALGAKLAARGVLRFTGVAAYLQAALALPADETTWTGEMWGHAVKLLGKKHRKLIVVAKRAVAA